jgi:hypothetical protein
MKILFDYIFKANEVITALTIININGFNYIHMVESTQILTVRMFLRGRTTLT